MDSGRQLEVKCRWSVKHDGWWSNNTQGKYMEVWGWCTKKCTVVWDRSINM